MRSALSGHWALAQMEKNPLFQDRSLAGYMMSQMWQGKRTTKSQLKHSVKKWTRWRRNPGDNPQVSEHHLCSSGFEHL